MEKFLRSINWVMLMVYSFLSVGLLSLIIYLAAEVGVHPALALAIQFFLMGVVAWVFSAMGEGKAWKLLAIPEWLAAAFLTALFIVVEGWMHPALFMAMVMFGVAGAVMYGRYLWKDQRAAKPQGIEWRPLGSGSERVDPLSAAERDHAPVGRNSRE